METAPTEEKQDAEKETSPGVNQANSDAKIGQLTTAITRAEGTPEPKVELSSREENVTLSRAGFNAILTKLSESKTIDGTKPLDYLDFRDDFKAKNDIHPPKEVLFDKYEEYLLASLDRREILREVRPTFVNEVLKQGSGRRERAEGLVDQLYSQPGGRVETPSSMVCIPLAIHNEAPENIRNTLAELSKQTDAGTNEIIIYANNPDDDDSKRKATDGLLALKPILDLYPNLNVRVIHRSYTEDELEDSMMRIRPDYMDAVVLEAHYRGLDPETPVIWLDADITKMGKDATVNLVRDVKSCRTPFVHPNLNFTVEMERLTTDLDPTNVDHLTAIDELLRRKANRGSQERNYIEECGLAFSLNTYCLSSGVTTERLGDPESGRGFGESAVMSHNLQTMIREMPRALVPVLYPGLPTLGYASKTKDSRVYTSSRRIKDTISGNYGAGVIGNPRDQYDMNKFSSEGYRDSGTNSGATVAQDFARKILNQSVDRNYPIDYYDSNYQEKRQEAKDRVQKLTRGRYEYL